MAARLSPFRMVMRTHSSSTIGDVGAGDSTSGLFETAAGWTSALVSESVSFGLMESETGMREVSLFSFAGNAVMRIRKQKAAAIAAFR